MGRIVWLASYPKSGNTWVRAFLSALVQGPDAFDLNRLDSDIVANRARLDEHLGIESSDLSHDEVSQMRPAFVRELAAALPDGSATAVKVHDAYGILADGTPEFAGEGVCGVVYIVRDPRDVAVSLAHHLRVDLDRAIAFMSDPRAAFARQQRRLSHQTPQVLGTWSDHVTSWTRQPDVPVLLVRYEDLAECALERFTAIASFGGWPTDPARVAAAIEATRFERLARAERSGGFSERPAHVETFFREGRAGAWRERLDENQVRRLGEAHGTCAERLGYLMG